MNTLILQVPMCQRNDPLQSLGQFTPPSLAKRINLQNMLITKHFTIMSPKLKFEDMHRAAALLGAEEGLKKQGSRDSLLWSPSLFLRLTCQSCYPYKL